MNRLTIALLLAHALALPVRAEAARRDVPPRVGIIVGAQGGAPGRAGLRHAHRDAQTMADVLTTVGRFPRDRVHLLRDPAPGELVAVLQREAAALSGRPDALLFFYFSGHADQGALYSGGRPVPLDAVRRALDRQDVAVRIGVIDACQGGGWTRAKGLLPDAPFEVTLPQVLESEGSALISSSTGDESAHESDALGGSFFTVHLAAGLRGAADESGDGDVTLTEAFEYARAQTIRDTARQAREPQHPSFALNLRGRQDLVLAQVAASPSTLAVEQERGPLELVHLATGLRMLELPPGRRSARIAVPPGRYLVRRLAPEGVRARELDVPRQGQVEVREDDLVLVASERLAVKGPPAALPASTPAALDWELSLGLLLSSYSTEVVGLQLGDWSIQNDGSSIRLDGRVGLTDRLAWRLGTLGFAYRLGSAGGTEVIPHGGLLAWRAGNYGGVRLGGGLGLRQPIGPGAIVATAGRDWEGNISRFDLSAWAVDRTHVAIGYGVQVGALGSFHLAVRFIRSHRNEVSMFDGMFFYPAITEDTVVMGSVQELGLASLPLIRLRLPSSWWLDVHAAAVVKGGGYLVVQEFSGGVSVLRVF